MSTKDKESKATSAPEAETIHGTRSTARLTIWIAVAIICVGLIGYITSRNSFTEKDVEAGLTVLRQDVNEYFGETGDYEFDLGIGPDENNENPAISLEGNIFSRRVILRNVSLALLPKEDKDRDPDEFRLGWSIDTKALSLTPSDASMGSFVLELEKPIDIGIQSSNSHLSNNYSGRSVANYRVIPQLPMQVLVKRKDSAEKKSIEYLMQSPEDSNYILEVDNFLQEIDVSGSDMEKASYQLRLGEGSVLKGVLDLTEKTYYAENDFKAMALEFGQSILKIDTLKTVYEVAGSDDSRFHHYNVDGSGISAIGQYQELGTLAAKFELEEEQPLATAAGEHLVEISNLLVTGEDFSLTGEGKLDMGEDDVLPYGTFSTEVKSVDALLTRLGKAALIPEASVPLVKAALEKAATPTEDGSGLVLNFQRPRGGAFTIGNSTFEELTVSLLHDFLKGSAVPAVVPAAPTGEETPVPAPAADESGEVAPVAIPEGEVEQPTDALKEAEETLKELRENVVPESAPEVAPVTEAPAVEEGAVAPDPAEEKPAEAKPADSVPVAE